MRLNGVRKRNYSAFPGKQNAAFFRSAPMTDGMPIGPKRPLLRLQHLSPAIHASDQVDMMGPPELARLLILDISGRLQPVVRTALPLLGFRNLLSRYRHFDFLLNSLSIAFR
jgi:hypothetical protein